MFLFTGSECKKLEESVAIKADLEAGKIRMKKFPDGEIYIRILEEVKDKRCVVMQSTPSNGALLELIFILDTLKELGAKEIYAVIPYLGYSRQDKRFLPGEALSVKTILGIIKERVESTATINAHFFDKAGKQSYDGIMIDNLNAFPLLADYFKDKLERPVLIAPDEGALGYVKEAAKQLELPYDRFQKTRISEEEVEMEIKNVNVMRKDVIILDDIISTGGTMIKATNLLFSQGARSVSIGAVHGVLEEGMKKISQLADEVICTNTIYQEKFSKLSVSSLIGEYIKG